MTIQPGEIRKAYLQYYDAKSKTMKHKWRPVLILAQADEGDYVVLPISRISRQENRNQDYDIQRPFNTQFDSSFFQKETRLFTKFFQTNHNNALRFYNTGILFPHQERGKYFPKNIDRGILFPYNAEKGKFFPKGGMRNENS